MRRQRLPAFAVSFALSEDPVPGHSHDMARAATTPLAHDNALKVAKVLALTALDILADPALLDAARDDFARSAIA